MLIRSRTRYFQSTRRRWWTGGRAIMDGFANTGSVYCCYGGNILLDRRMGLWHLTIFSIHNVSHYWIWWCRSPKRGSKFCSLFTVWTLSSNCAKLVLLLRWFFLKENVSGLRLNLVQFYSYLPGSFCAIAVFQLNWWIILEKIHFIVSSATNGGVIYRFQYLLQDPTWCFNCSFPFVTFINSNFQRKICLSSSFKFIHAFCKSVSLICIVSF